MPLTRDKSQWLQMLKDETAILCRLKEFSMLQNKHKKTMAEWHKKSYARLYLQVELHLEIKKLR